MADPMTPRNPFRVDLYFHHKLNQIEVGPRPYRDEPVDVTGTQGTLRGRDEMKLFIETVGLDSIVWTEQLSDLPSPQFRQTFELHPSETIVSAIERRFEAFYEAFSRVIDGTPINEIDPRAFHTFERLTLGATTFDTRDGVARLRRWFSPERSAVRNP